MKLATYAVISYRTSIGIRSVALQTTIVLSRIRGLAVGTQFRIVILKVSSNWYGMTQTRIIHAGRWISFTSPMPRTQKNVTRIKSFRGKR
jgi:hypothetical protein